uniref:Uncharacterized protein n=1 Tax=Arundo donax TaxID=35708 RepID=A0A0A9ATX6_ARUDO
MNVGMQLWKPVSNFVYSISNKWLTKGPLVRALMGRWILSRGTEYILAQHIIPMSTDIHWGF